MKRGGTGMAKKKKVNPRRKPATLADVNKAKKEAMDIAITSAWAILFTALRDKEGFGYIRLRRVWDEVNYLSDSIGKGYVNIDDLIEELRENGIALA
jgi:hypothetical protein